MFFDLGRITIAQTLSCSGDLSPLPPMATLGPITYVNANERTGFAMARLVLALLIISIAAVMIAVAVKSVARMIEVARGDGTADIGNSMQKIAFFVLICLMAYVSMSGGS